MQQGIKKKQSKLNREWENLSQITQIAKKCVLHLHKAPTII